jgi:hypothetical protein
MRHIIDLSMKHNDNRGYQCVKDSIRLVRLLWGDAKTGGLNLSEGHIRTSNTFLVLDWLLLIVMAKIQLPERIHTPNVLSW